MSSRQLRKLQKQRELDQLQAGAKEAENENESSEDEAPSPIAAKPRVSMFAALGGDDDANDDDDEANQSDRDANTTAAPPAEQSDPEDLPQPAKKSKNKKKKKKAKKNAAANATAADKGDPSKDPEMNQDEDDEIDLALRELNIARDKAAAATVNSTSTTNTRRDADRLLQINPHNLKVIHEMRNLFGREAIEAAQHEEQAEQEAERRRIHRGPAAQQLGLEQVLQGHPWQKLPEVSLRRNMFIQGKDTWPRATAEDFTMKEIRQGDDGLIEFAYHHGPKYDHTQGTFFSMVQMADPMILVTHLQAHPYHITTLLQVSKVATQDQNAALASELCERALFTFGRVSTSAFRQKLEQGKARLDFRRPENREFWLAGYHYIKSLMRKGTYRTALEWAKLLFSLNPNDPYAMKNLLHPLAIRAHEAQWLVDFCNEPEFVADNTDDRYVKQTLVLARLQLGDTDGARALAAEGMQTVPWVYSAIFQALNLDVPQPLWGVRADDGNRGFWTELYLHQTKDLWDNAQATALLKEAVKLATKVDVREMEQDDPADLRTSRFIFLEGNTQLISGVPRHILARQPNWEFDPLPPPVSDNIFSEGIGMRGPWESLLEDPAKAQALLEQLRQELLGHRNREAARQRRRLDGAQGGGEDAPFARGGLGDFLLGDEDGDFGARQARDEDENRDDRDDRDALNALDEENAEEDATMFQRVIADYLDPLLRRMVGAGPGSQNVVDDGGADEDEGLLGRNEYRHRGLPGRMPGGFDSDDDDDYEHDHEGATNTARGDNDEQQQQEQQQRPA